MSSMMCASPSRSLRTARLPSLLVCVGTIALIHLAAPFSS